MAPLFQLPQFQNVTVLNLRNNRIRDVDMLPISSSHANQFKFLNLADNNLTQVFFKMFYFYFN